MFDSHSSRKLRTVQWLIFNTIQISLVFDVRRGRAKCMSPS